MAHTIVLGRFSYIVLAMAWTPCSSTPVISFTTSGGYLATSSRTLSMPYTRAWMKALSSQPFLKMCHRMPFNSATSEPERWRKYMSAFAAVRVKRGSTTMILQPFSFACSVCSIDTGCASAAFDPRKKMHFEFCMSLYELVIAP